MQKFIKRTLPHIEGSAKISLGVDTVGILDLPKFESGKRLTCPPSTTITELIQFLSKQMNFEKHFLVSASSFDPLNYVEIVLPINQKKRSPSKTQQKQ